MTNNRVNPEAGFQRGLRPKGPTGRPLCRECSQECPKGRRTFCSDSCVDRWKIKSDPTYVRRKVFDRDRGLCAACGLDTVGLENAIKTVKLFSQHSFPASHREPQGRPYVDAELRALLKKLGCQHRKSFWDADHALPVAEGGGECGIEGFQTLCCWCHRAKTARQVRKGEQSNEMKQTN